MKRTSIKRGRRVNPRQSFRSHPFTRPMLEPLEQRLMLNAVLDLEPMGSQGTITTEAGHTVIEVASGGGTLDVTAKVLSSTQSITAFQLDFDNSSLAANQLSLSNFAVNGSWSSIDGTLDTASDDTFVAGGSFAGNSAPVTLGTLVVNVPTTPGDYTLTVNAPSGIGGGTSLTTGLFTPTAIPIDDYGDLIIRVPGAVVPTVSVADAAANEGEVAPVSSIALAGTVRDFIGTGTTSSNQGSATAHPDFENRDFLNWRIANPNTIDAGIVSSSLGSDGKPVFAAAKNTASTADNFNQWFNDDAAVNSSKPHAIVLQRDADNPAIYSFDAQEFYPIDNMLFGNTQGATLPDGLGERNVPADHNWNFTYETHAQFVYRGGETLTIASDDDHFAYINDFLVSDRGGVNIEIATTVELDDIATAAGLVVGQTYDFDLFYAERHTEDAVLKVTTDIAFDQIGDLAIRYVPFEVTLSEMTTNTVMVDYATTGGTATSDGDFLAATGTVTFQPGETSRKIFVPIIGDTADETNETFTLTLSNPTNATIGDGTAIGTINDDDEPVVTTASITGVKFNDADGDGQRDQGEDGIAGVEITLVGPGVNTTTNTGSDGSYSFTSLPAGQYTVTETVPQGFTPTTDNPVVLVLADGQAAVVDFGNMVQVTAPTVEISLSDNSAGEPEDHGQFTVTRTGTAGNLTVNYAITGTATNGGDYQTLSGSVVIPDGSDSMTIDITVIDDSDVETDETVILTLTNDASYNLGTNISDTLTITSDDVVKPVVNLVATDSDAGEPDNDGSFTISRDLTDGDLTVSILITGTATNGTDYQTIASSVVIPDGDANVVVNLDIIDDSDIDPNETVILTLDTSGDYNPGENTSATIVIADDDTPTVSYDFGDAPDSYGTTLANDGARHVIDTQIQLKTSAGEPAIDAEADGQPSVDAKGDDLNGVDDEEGVLPTGSFFIDGNQPGSIFVSATVDRYVSVWIDWNIDGDFSDPGEQVVDDAILGDFFDGLYFDSFDIDVPNSAVAGKTYARVRLTTTQGIGPTGLAQDGEVEDMVLYIQEYQPVGTAPGNRDGSFGGDGFAQVPNINNIVSNLIVDLTMDSAGRTIALIQGENATVPVLGLVRYRTNGTLDNSFGNGGVVTLLAPNIPGFSNVTFGGTRIGVTDNDKIIVGGGIVADIPGQFYDFVNDAVIAFNANGTPDTSFGNMGVFLPTASNDDNVQYVQDMAVQADGKVLVLTTLTVEGRFTSVISRINPNGSLDTSFADNGEFILDLSASMLSALPSELAILPDGDIVLAASLNTNKAVIRLNPDGSIDTGFGDNGTAMVELGDLPEVNFTSISQIAAAPDGKIVVAGRVDIALSGDRYVGIARLNPDGSADTSFGDNGVVNYSDDQVGTINDLLVLPDTSVIFAAQGTTLSAQGGLLTRLNPDGSLYTDFGTAGTARYNTPDDQIFNSYLATLKLDTDGNILAGGSPRGTSGGFTETDPMLLKVIAGPTLSNNPIISVSADVNNPPSEDGATGTFTFTRSNILDGAVAATYVITGTATDGTDYQMLAGTVDFADQQTSVTVTITPIDDDLVEGAEDITLTVAAGVGYDVGTPSSATLPLIDNDQPQPDIDVSLEGTPLTDGQAGAVDLGTVLQGSSTSLQISLTITNTGDAPLSLGDIDLPDGFDIVAEPASPLAPGASTTLTIELASPQAGTFTGNLVIASNDADEPNFTIPLSGTVTKIIQMFDFTSGLPETFMTEGLVGVVDLLGNSVAQLTEGSDAAFSQTLTLPLNAGTLAFDYRFTNVGDGDALQVLIDGEVVASVVGTEVGVTDLMPFTPVDISSYAGEEVTVEIRLASTGETNAQIQVDNVEFLTADVEFVTFDKKVSYVDDDGDTVTIILAGPGRGELVLPTGGVGDAAALILSDTTPASRVIVRVSGGGDTTIRRVDVQKGDDESGGELNLFNARQVNLGQVFNADGPVRRIVLGDILPGQTNFRLGGGNDSPAASITLGDITDLNFSSAQPLANVTFNTWTDTPASDVDDFTGTVVRSLRSKGDFQANLTLTGTGGGNTLVNARVDGDIVGGAAGLTWNITGDTSTIDLRGNASDLDINIASNLRNLRMGVATDVIVNVGDGDINNVIAREWVGGSLTAATTRTIRTTGFPRDGIAGDLGIDITLTGSGRVTNLINVRNDIPTGAWHFGQMGQPAADVSRILAHHIAGGVDINLTGGLGALIAKGQAGDLAGDMLSIAADSAGVLNFRDDLENATIELTKPRTDNSPALRNLTVARSATQVILRTLADVNAVTVGGLADSDILVGADPSVTGLPASVNDLDADATLKRLTTRGVRNDASVMQFLNANVVAGRMLNVNITLEESDNTADPGTPFGLASTDFGIIRITTATNGKIILRHPGQAPDFDGDFVIDILDMV